MSASRFQLYTRRQYYEALVSAATHAGPGDRLIVQSMVLNPDIPEAAGIARALIAAACRGADVMLVLDAYNFLLSENDKPGPLLLHGRIDPTRLSEPFRSTYGLLEELRQAGGNVAVINQPARRFSLPYAGRSHVKLALLNERVFIGGCNLDVVEDLDIMVGWDDAVTADRLRAFVGQVTAAGSVSQALDGIDQTIATPAGGQLFIDAGVHHQSTILEQAYQLIDQAKQTLVITCQYFPGGQTAQRLLAAHRRGVQVTILYSPPSRHGHLAIGHWLYDSRERLRLPASFFAHQLGPKVPKLHAKVIASESSVMLGSHNYVAAGVRLGTAEIALLQHDAQLSADVIDNIQSQIAAYQTA